MRVNALFGKGDGKVMPDGPAPEHPVLPCHQGHTLQGALSWHMGRQ
jgi:hypothetical protein